MWVICCLAVYAQKLCALTICLSGQCWSISWHYKEIALVLNFFINYCCPAYAHLLFAWVIGVQDNFLLMDWFGWLIFVCEKYLWYSLMCTLLPSLLCLFCIHMYLPSCCFLLSTLQLLPTWCYGNWKHLTLLNQTLAFIPQCHHCLGMFHELLCLFLFSFGTCLLCFLGTHSKWLSLMHLEQLIP